MAPTILQLIPELNVGGAEKTVLEMVEAIRAEGWQALVVSEGGRLVPKIEAAGGEVIHLPVKSKNPYRLWRNGQHLKNLIVQRGVDLVHARSRAPAWSGLWAARAAHIPFVTTYHGAHSQKTALKRFYNSVMARGDVVIANSEYTALQIKTHHGAYIQRLETVYRGVDLEATNLAVVGDDRVARLQQKWGLYGSEFVILQPARLSRRKGQLDVIAAMARLKQQSKLDDVVVIMAGAIEGNEAYHEEVLNAIKVAGLENIIKCVGYSDDMPAAFALSDMVLAVSSKPESFGRVVAESLAMGLPTVVSDVGAQREIVLDNEGQELEGAVCVPPSEPEKMATAIDHLMSLTDEERQKLRKVLRQHVAAKYSIETMKQQTMGIYSSLLGGLVVTEGEE